MPELTIYTIGWICAVVTEVVAARAFLDEEYDPVDDVPLGDDNSYTLGRIGRHHVVVANLPKAQYGTTNATSVINHMVRTFPNLRFCLMVGIGGGAPIPPLYDVRLGDLVISAPHQGRGGVLEYDFGKTIQNQDFVPTGALNQPPLVLLKAVASLEGEYEFKGRRLLEKVAGTVTEKLPTDVHPKYTRPTHDKLYRSQVVHGESPCCRENAPTEQEGQLLVTTRPSRKNQEPVIHCGLIASGNRLMKDATLRDKLATERGILCFETEAAGLMNMFPTLVIRGICDYADSHKNKDWQGFAAMAAAAYAKDLLNRIAPQAVESEERIRERLSRIESLLYDKHKSAVLDWLTQLDFSDQQRYYSRSHQRGTGQWFLNSPEYQAWLDQRDQVLVCSGLQGSGKSVMMSTVVNDLQSRVFGSEATAVAYAYCFGHAKKKLTVTDLVAGLLKQLARRRPPLQNIREGLNEMYEARHDADHRERFHDQLRTLLERVIAGFERFFLVIDDADQSREVCEYARDLQESTGLNLMLSFKDSFEMRKFLFERPNALRTNISASEDDVKSCLEERLAELPKSFREITDLRDDIVQTISRRAGGRFSVVPALFAKVKKEPSPKRIRALLRFIEANDSEPLKDLYESAMVRIAQLQCNLHTRQMHELAHQALCWTALKFDSPYGLTIAAFQEALAVEQDHAGVDPQNLRDLDSVVASIPEFLEAVGEGDDRVNLSNDTTYNFFDNLKGDIPRGSAADQGWPPNKADRYMASVCLLYLRHSLESSAGADAAMDVAARFPLHPYAYRWWAHHARCAIQEHLHFQTEHCHQAKEVFGTSPMLGDKALTEEIFWLLFRYDSKGNPRSTTSPLSKREALGEAAFYGLPLVVDMMLKREFFAEKADPTPLLAAFEGTYIAWTQGFYRGQVYRTSEDERIKSDKVTEVFNMIIDALLKDGAFNHIAHNDKTALSSALEQQQHSLVHILRVHEAKEHEAGGKRLMDAWNKGTVPLGEVVHRTLGTTGSAANAPGRTGYRSEPVVMRHGDDELPRSRPRLLAIRTRSMVGYQTFPSVGFGS